MRNIVLGLKNQSAIDADIVCLYRLCSVGTASFDIGNYVKSTIANWIVKGGVENEWDSYVQQLDKLGLEKALQLYQAAYNRFHGID